jgi:hypothetical protein
VGRSGKKWEEVGRSGNGWEEVGTGEKTIKKRKKGRKG